MSVAAGLVDTTFRICYNFGRRIDLSESDPMPKRLRVSYSAVQDWRKCQQLYYYRHVENLRPKVRQAAPELGTIIHDYFARYYEGLLRERNLSPKELHNRSLSFTLNKAEPQIKSLAALADGLGAEDEAKKLLAIPKTAKRLLQAYFRVRGADDAKRHEVLAVEHKFELLVGSVNGKRAVLPGQIDLVTRSEGHVWLWEHKTTGSVPSQGRRFRDLQTLIYKVAVEELLSLELTGVVWNYVRTTPPKAPRLLQSGVLSTAKSQTTTVDLYRSAIRKNGLDTYKYDVFLRQIEHREREMMFPRHTLPLVQAEDVLLRDYIASVEQIQTAASIVDFVPVRTIDAQCDWCGFVKLCQAAIAGGDLDELRQRHFVESEQKG